MRKAVRETPPLVLFGSYNERMYAAEAGGRAMYIPASFPGAIIRRHTGTPFMGYAGAVYLVQEVCNALFDALFNILPLGTELDKVDATPARLHREMPWDDEAKRLLDELVDATPVSCASRPPSGCATPPSAKRSRAGDDQVTTARVEHAREAGDGDERMTHADDAPQTTFNKEGEVMSFDNPIRLHRRAARR